MIVFLVGTVAAVGPGYADIDVHGVGYRVYLTDAHLATLRTGEGVRVYTYHHVREDAMLLYGFESEVARSWFEQLISVSGIGPKGAMQVLSGMDADHLGQAILREDVDALTRLPGIGRKTAQRLIVELKGRVAKLAGEAAPMPPEAVAPAPALEHPVTRDVVEALVALGYNEKQAAEQVAAVLAAKEVQTPDDVSALLRAALQRMNV
ncbi:MAG: Holliday junction branch migration protein RuvA [Alicyclobacillus sp.]|nr:Holliday junction branch migration protein RuvA [Alicyclobacillus sp.]